MKKTTFLSSLFAIFLLGFHPSVQAQTDSTPNVIFETTVARYCQGMELIGTLDDQTKLFFSHDNSLNYITFPEGAENKGIVLLTHLQSSEGPHVEGLIKCYNAYTALCDDHTILNWGDKEACGEMPAELVGEHAKRVSALVHPDNGLSGFAALLEDGTVFSWGPKIPKDFDFATLEDHTTNLSTTFPLSIVIPPINHVVSLFSNTTGFTALIRDGEKEKLFSWNLNGDTFNIPDIGNSHVKSIKTSNMSFAAILDDDTWVMWGKVEDHISTPLLQPGERVLSLFSDSGTSEKVAYLNSGRLISWADYNPPEVYNSATLPVAGKTILKITDNAVLFDDYTGFSWDSHGCVESLYPHGDVVDVASTVIFGIPVTLSSEGTVSEGLRDITPATPRLRKIISISTTPIPSIDAYFGRSDTVSLTPIDMLSQFAIAGDEMSSFDPNRLGDWEYQLAGSNEWKHLEVWHNFYNNSAILRADTKIRFVSNKIDDPYFVPRLTMRLLGPNAISHIPDDSDTVSVPLLPPVRPSAK